MLEITVSEVVEKLKNEEHMNIIDVREPEEVEEGMIPGAVHIPLGDIMERLDAFDEAEEYIIVCRSGGRSGLATEALTGVGIHATNMLGGMLAWTGDIE